MENYLSSITVKDSVFDPAKKKDKPVIYYRTTRDNSQLYKVWLYLDGPSVPFVEKVTYYLHPTFPNPVQTVIRSPANPNCKFFIWTWGIFTVKILLEDKQGGKIEISHYLTYDQEIQHHKGEFIRA